MGRPSTRQIAEAIDQMARGRVSDEEVDERLAGLSRQSDEELAAMGIVPPPEPDPDPAPDPTDPDPLAFDPATLKTRHDGWTAERQRTFIAALAETGCVSEACGEVGITARSAYRLREHPAAAGFRAAWDHAQSIASVRLTALAWERAVHGTPDRIYKDGVLVAERRKPSDKLLMWLLTHHHPGAYGWASKPPGQAPDLHFFPIAYARAELAGTIAGFADVPPDQCPAECVPSSGYIELGEEPGA